MKRLFSVFFGLFFALVLCCVNVSAQNNVPKIIDGGVINGKAVNLVKPDYPPAAKSVGASGQVQVQVTINEEGNVISAIANGHPLLTKVSEDAALASKFSPTLLSGKPVKVSGIIVYNFTPAANSKATEDVAKPTDCKVIGGVVNGQATKLPKPEYPAAAKAVKASGTVYIQVTIDEEGNVISAKGVSGHPLLKVSAENAAKEAKFSPTFLDGKPVKVTGIIVYNFTLPRKTKK